jgi:peroxiredoxin
MSPVTGEPAADFTLPSTQGSTSLAHVLQHHKVVLAFYVEDGTPT